jgi:hypothetical protein
MAAPFPVPELRSAGSSLKFCLIARGYAEVHPRMAPTMEMEHSGRTRYSERRGWPHGRPRWGGVALQQNGRRVQNGGSIARGREPLP